MGSDGLYASIVLKPSESAHFLQKWLLSRGYLQIEVTKLFCGAIMTIGLAGGHDFLQAFIPCFGMIVKIGSIGKISFLVSKIIVFWELTEEKIPVRPGNNLKTVEKQ